jgi:signal transduction histidine kinase
MHWQFTPPSLMYFLAGAVTLGAASIIWQREQRGARLLAAAMLCMSIRAGASGLALAAVELESGVGWVILADLAGGTLVNLLLVSILEYHDLARGFKPARYWLLWIPTGALVLLQLTNPWHHLIWSGREPGPVWGNLSFHQPGLVYSIAIGYAFFLGLVCLALLIRQALRSSGRQRRRTVWLSLGLGLPFAAALMDALRPSISPGVDILPIGFAACGLVLSRIAFEDLQFRMAGQTHELQAGIGQRRKLENDLLQAQDALAERLADQSRKLSGFYDLILIGNRPLEIDQLLVKSLDKIFTVTGCEAVCFYVPRQDRLHLEASHQLNAREMAELQSLPEGWLPAGRDVRADVSTADSAGLPGNFARSGFGAGMHKHMYVQERLFGTLSVLWRAPRRFSVDEIVLFGTLTDQLGIIFENARLRQRIADAATLQERRRLARDLHDSVTQSLHSLVLSSETAGEIFRTQPDRLEKTLAHLGASARQALKEMRLLLYELRLVPLEEIPFLEAIRNRLDAVERRAAVQVDFHVDAETVWPKSWELEMYPIAMEALNNVLKHSSATRVEVRLTGGQDTFSMHVQDNGCGFDPLNVSGGGMGLYNMAERAGRLKGRLEVRSVIGQGTEIVLFVDQGSGTNPL